MARYTPLLVAVLMILSGAALAEHEESASTLSLDTTVDEVRGWSVGSNNTFNGCWIKATYKDQTTVWMGYSGGERQAYIAFTNPKWRSIQPGEKYTLGILAQGQSNWRGQFIGVEVPSGEKGVFGGPLKEGFMSAMARAGGVTLSLGQSTVARLSLSGSSAALDTAQACHRAYQEARNGNDGGPTDGGIAPAARKTPEPKSKEGSSGTGFFVSAQGHVMTNYHVIESCTMMQVIPAGSPPVAASVVAKDSTNDLAVLRTKYEPDAIAVLNPRIRIGESIYVYGFPLSGILASTGNFTIGNITATAGLEDDTRMVQISAPVQPGNSGGSLVDQYGNTVGVIVSKLNVLNIAKLTNGDLPQNVNFAIKASVAINFLESNNITANTTAKTAIRDAATIAEEAKLFTVKVVCQ